MVLGLVKVTSYNPLCVTVKVLLVSDKGPPFNVQLWLNSVSLKPLVIVVLSPLQIVASGPKSIVVIKLPEARNTAESYL